MRDNRADWYKHVRHQKVKVFIDDQKLGDLWCLKISSCLERIDEIVRHAEGEEVRGFTTISNPLCDLIVELELLAVLTETKAPLLDPLEPMPDFETFEILVGKLLKERDEEVKRLIKKSGKRKSASVVTKRDDREGIAELISICKKNLELVLA